MKSSLKNMTLVLLLITFVSSACVGGVYMLTKDTIAQAAEAAKQAAIKQVLPDGAVLADAEQFELDGLTLTVNPATVNGEQCFAVETITKEGFGGEVALMVGLSAEGRVLNVNVLRQSETPGLGTHMCDEDNALIRSFKDKVLAEMNLKVKKDGGDVDALTAATISSRAYTDAMSRALAALNEYNNRHLPAEPAVELAEEEGVETAREAEEGVKNE